MKLPAKLVVVHWTDAFDSVNGWITVKEYKPKACYVISVGFLWENCLAGHISITGSWFPDSDQKEEASECGMISHIPIGMVNKMVEISTADFSSLDLSAYGETIPTLPHDPTTLSPALDYPPYEVKVPHATSHQTGRRAR